MVLSILGAEVKCTITMESVQRLSSFQSVHYQTVSHTLSLTHMLQGDTGSNLVSVTCIDPQTEELAMKEPQKFDLVRNRMGGWSNFFVAMFNEHQLQHMRRPMYGPAKEE